VWWGQCRGKNDALRSEIGCDQGFEMTAPSGSHAVSFWNFLVVLQERDCLGCFENLTKLEKRILQDLVGGGMTKTQPDAERSAVDLL
jgi:hypothetical protein